MKCATIQYTHGHRRIYNDEPVALSSPTHIQILQWEIEKKHTQNEKRITNLIRLITRIYLPEISAQRKRMREKKKHEMHMIKIDQMVERITT